MAQLEIWGEKDPAGTKPVLLPPPRLSYHPSSRIPSGVKGGLDEVNLNSFL